MNGSAESRGVEMGRACVRAVHVSGYCMEMRVAEGEDLGEEIGASSSVYR